MDKGKKTESMVKKIWLDEPKGYLSDKAYQEYLKELAETKEWLLTKRKNNGL